MPRYSHYLAAHLIFPAPSSLCTLDTEPTEPTLIFQTHFHTSLSLNVLLPLSGILSHVRYSEKLFLMPEAGPITLFPLFKEPWAPYFYSMYLPELQLILYMSSPHPLTTILAIPWRQGPCVFCSLLTPLHPVQVWHIVGTKKNISWIKEKWKYKQTNSWEKNSVSLFIPSTELWYSGMCFNKGPNKILTEP